MTWKERFVPILRLSFSRSLTWSIASNGRAGATSALSSDHVHETSSFNNDFELFDLLKLLPNDLLHGLGRKEDPADLSKIVDSSHHLADLVGSPSARAGVLALANEILRIKPDQGKGPSSQGGHDSNADLALFNLPLKCFPVKNLDKKEGLNDMKTLFYFAHSRPSRRALFHRYGRRRGIQRDPPIFSVWLPAWVLRRRASFRFREISGRFPYVVASSAM